MIDHEVLLQTFQAETAEGFTAMEEALIALERRPEDREALDTVFRLAHTLKGNAAVFGFSAVTGLAHVVEDLLDSVRDGDLSVTSEIVTTLLQAVDALKVTVDRATSGQSEETEAATEALIDKLARLKSGRDVDAAAPQGISEAASATPRASSSQANRTLRVDLDRLDHLLDLTGEIGVARGRLTQMIADPAVPRDEILETRQAADLLYAELQELVTQLRMVPVGPMFRQHIRTVRDLAESHGKIARLEIEGEDVEVDTTVIEHLRDPLTHMIRNALDHGIEPPAERQAKGKDLGGLIVLRAWHDAGTIVIELADDGAGPDREKILAKARSSGLVKETAMPTAQQIDQLIFEPGFSTAESVTELSGRGVGMDVVRRNIEALRGSVSVAGRPGKGTRITIRLPLTLAIIEGLNVGIGDETYVIPIDCVTETLAFRPQERYRTNGHGVIHLRGRSLPYVRLRSLFHLDGDPPRRESIVVVQYQNGEAGLVVDALHGESQTVIKPLARLLQGLPGISGSAILGNGRVAFILDVPDLLRREIERDALAGEGAEIVE